MEERKFCPSTDQMKYVTRDWCGWSSINGTRLSDVKLCSLKVLNGPWFGRNEMDKLSAYIKREEILQATTAWLEITTDFNTTHKAHQYGSVENL